MTILTINVNFSHLLTDLFPWRDQQVSVGVVVAQEVEGVVVLPEWHRV
jgi:hypothetical protein